MQRDELKRIARDWRVVAVDDDLESVRLIQRCLGFYGAEAYVTDKSEQAMALIVHVRPLFVITDLAMPVVNGFDLLRAIRANEWVCDTPVVALTAHAMLEMHEKAVKAGFDGFFTKPFGPSELVSNLADLVRVWSAPQSAIVGLESPPASASRLLARLAQPCVASR